MPLTQKGQEILSKMQSEYGEEKGKSVFYASKNTGKITGVDSAEDPKDTKDCAGLLVRAPGPTFLLLKRANREEWEHSGGHILEGEDPEEAAWRESAEETDFAPINTLTQSLGETQNDGFTYKTFLNDAGEEFTPKLSKEHTHWGWFSPDALPNHTHPDVRKNIKKVGDKPFVLAMTDSVRSSEGFSSELDVAKALRDGHLQSPQVYENIFLFDLRITGTGISYRKALDEHVYRTPENFLTADFLERCNGLPLIFEHPASSLLNTQEYRDRAIGTVILPYVKGDEVWGIAKVYDREAAHLMMTTHISTSPAVYFRHAGSMESVEIGDGKTLVIEGKPSLLDHLAICEAGVWDKGGEPSGINIGDTKMPEKEPEKTENDLPAFMDKIDKKIDSLSARMDGYEKGNATAKDAILDHAKKDAEEKEKEEKEKKEREDAEKLKKDGGKKKDESEEEKKKHEEEEKARDDKKRKDEEEREKEMKEDSARKDSQIKTLTTQVDGLQAQIAHVTKGLSSDERNALAKAQSRVDSMARSLGEDIPPPHFGETPLAYEKRAVSKFLKYAKADKIKAMKIDSLPPDVFDFVKDQVYADAQSAAMDPNITASSGGLYYESRKELGREILVPHGDSSVFIGRHSSPGYRMKGGFRTDFQKK